MSAQQAIDNWVSSGPSMVPCLSLNFLFHFVPGCWRQLTLTRQAMRRFTGHLNWPLCNNKEISGLLSAVPGNAAACRAVLANTFRDGPGAHGKGCDMVMQIKAWAGMANGVKAKTGKAWQMQTR